MYCIDSSILAAFVVKEEGWKKLIKYLVDGVTIDLAFKETLNVIWKKAKLLNEEIDIKNALLKIKKLRKVLIIYPQEELHDLALEISLENNISIYDALFIALALNENLTLVTKDKRQKEVAEKLNIDVILEK